MHTRCFIDKEHELIKEIVKTIKTYLEPKRIILFGSRANGTNKKYSDFDIAIEGVEMDFRKECLLKDELDEKLGIFMVDIISFDKVDKEFKKMALKNSRILYGR